MEENKLICVCPDCGQEIFESDYIYTDEQFNLLYQCDCEIIVNEYGIVVESNEDEELECSRCGSNDLQNFGGCYICNDCGLEENI